MRDQPRTRGRFFSAAFMLAACSALALSPAILAREAKRASALKADYLLNFMKFVEWPRHVPADAITVCFIGDSGVYDELSTGLADKHLGTRELVVRRLATAEPTDACQVLYVDADQLAGGASDWIATRPTALLTVSDAPEFLKSGGIIALFYEDNRLRFRISLENARVANLRISSQLLQLASTVSDRADRMQTTTRNCDPSTPLCAKAPAFSGLARDWRRT